jgi:hypothetical protein
MAAAKAYSPRLPLLLAGGLASQAEAPLDLTAGGVSHATRYEDLIYQRSAQPFSLDAEISDGNRTLQFVTTLRHIVERHALGIEAFELSEGQERIVSITAARPEDIGNPAGAFRAKFGAAEAEREIRIQMLGLFPAQIEGNVDVSNRLRERRELFEKAIAGPSYLGPFRSEVGSLSRIPRQGARDLGPRGERTLDIIGDDRLHEKFAERSLLHFANLFWEEPRPKGARNAKQKTECRWAPESPKAVTEHKTGYKTADTL